MKSVASVSGALAALCLIAACDPVVDNAIAALPGEQRGVHPGPRHRPGQRCLLCHDGELGDPREFSVAGTVFERPTGAVPARGATVELTNADGSKYDVVANEAGNFYLYPSDYTPKFPLQVKVQYQGQTVTMHSVIGREGACAACHADPAGAASPGHVYVTLDDGGVPP
jgi:hypothetical protein